MQRLNKLNSGRGRMGNLNVANVTAIVLGHRQLKR